MQQDDPKSEMELFMQKYKVFLTYLAGNPLNARDLQRGDTHKADSCVILTNKNSKSAAEEDHLNILTALAIKKYVFNKSRESKEDCKSNIKVCMQLIKPESKILYYKSLNLPSTNDQLIIVEEIKMNLLAKSCFAPGLISVISNLFASAGEVKTDENQDEWIKEYAQGMGHEVYRVLISDNEFQGDDLNFMKVANLGFHEFSAIIFALEIEIKNQPGNKSIIRLNPINFIFQDWNIYNYYLYIICEDEAVAKQVQKLEMPEEHYLKYFSNPKQTENKVTRVASEKKETFNRENLASSAVNMFMGKSMKAMNTQEADDEAKAALVNDHLFTKREGIDHKD